MTYGTGSDDVVVAEYEYDGMNRRIRKQVQNCGTGVVNGSDDGGIILDTPRLAPRDLGEAARGRCPQRRVKDNRHEHHYYAGWRVIEERDASDDVLAQTVHSTEYIDAPVCRDRNTDVASDDPNDADACLDSGGARRYFYHQDANYRVIALTDESGEVGSLLAVSSVGNPYMHQGLRRDDETGLHENRMRTYSSRLGRFIQRDPAEYIDSMNLYEYVRSNVCNTLDPLGLSPPGTGTGAAGPVVLAHALAAATAAITAIAASQTEDLAWAAYYEALDAIEYVETLLTAATTDARARLQSLRDQARRVLNETLKKLKDAAKKAAKKKPKKQTKKTPRERMKRPPNELDEVIKYIREACKGKSTKQCIDLVKKKYPELYEKWKNWINKWIGRHKDELCGIDRYGPVADNRVVMACIDEAERAEPKIPERRNAA